MARVSYDGKTVDYRSVAEIDRAIEALDREIAAAEGRRDRAAGPRDDGEGPLIHGLCSIASAAGHPAALRACARVSKAPCPGAGCAAGSRRWRTSTRWSPAGGPRLLARARELVVTNGYAANACEAFAANLVGDGIKPSSLIEDRDLRDRLQRLWLAWTDEADADGLTDFYGLQAMVAREMFVAGECFVRLRPRRAEDGLTVPLQLQLLQSEMLPFEKTETAANGNRIRCGIEFDAIGRRVAYHFRRRHPGDSTDQGAVIPETVRVPAEDVLHVYRPIDAGPDQGTAACRSGDGAAVPARPVRRRRARPEEDRRDVRGLHHQVGARRTADGRGRGGGRWHRHRQPRARNAAGAAARART